MSTTVDTAANVARGRHLAGGNGSKAAKPIILIDTREQAPFAFSLPTEAATLDTGDYSVKGLQHLIAVERKSLDDLLACCGRERDRFKRELQRLQAYWFRLLVIESDATTLEAGRWRSKLHSSHTLGSLAAWSAQFTLPIWLGGDHEACGRHVERYLYQCVRRVRAEYEVASGVTDDPDVFGSGSREVKAQAGV